jgi:hypothetical protein
LLDEVIAEVQRRRAELLANPEISLDEEAMWRRVDGYASVASGVFS